MGARNVTGLWAGLSCGVQLLASSAMAQTSTGGPAAAPALEEVVVTAQRRAERLQDVPISVGVFSQEQLDAQGLRNIDDLTRFSPGVTFIRSGTGSNGNYNDANSDFNIRGVDSSSGASTVAVYIDDTPIQSRRIGFGTFNTFPTIFDLDHVEVLRGPQGTLFGASSEGGNVRFITPQPGLDKYSSYVRAELASTTGGDPTYEAGAAFGGPIISDKLGFRVSASYRREGGWVDRVDRMTLASVDKASNWTSYASARLAFKWVATDKLTVSPSFYVQETQINDTAIWWPELSSSSSHLNGNKQANPSTDPFYLAALRIDWNLGAVQLFSNTSFYSRNQHSVSDYSQYDRASYYNFTSAVLGTCPPGPAAIPPCAYLPGPGDAGSSYFTDTQNNLYQEIRLQSTDPSARLSWTAGVYYAHLNENSKEFIVDPTLDANFPPPGSAVCYIPCPGGLIYYQPYFKVIDKQLAGYGNADVKLTSTLKAILGLRVSHATYTGSSLYGGPFVAPTPVLGNNSGSASPVTPRLGLSWQPERDHLYYATAANGYRVGNLNVDVGNLCAPDLNAIGLTSAPGTSRSDSLWSYELGGKNTLLDRTLQLNLSLFIIDWKDIQQSFYLPSCGLQFATNLGRVRSRGGDLELTYHPTPALLLYFDAAYTDAKYTGTACASTSVNCTSPGSPFLHIVTERDRLPGPPWSFVGSAEYSFTWGADSKPYARIDYQYSTAQTALVQVQNIANGGADPTQTGLPAVRSLDVRLGWRHGGFDLSLFGQNLTNSNPVLFRTRDIPAPFDQTHFDRGIRPRTVGMSGTWRF
jgi:outer membrane receptor protein involved in Fe transport